MPNVLNAGSLNQRVTLQRPAITQADTGEEVTMWEDVRDVWAAVLPIKGHERLRDGVLLADVDARILIRSAADLRDDMGPKWRAIHRGRVYSITQVADHRSDGEYLELLAAAGANAG